MSARASQSNAWQTVVDRDGGAAYATRERNPVTIQRLLNARDTGPAIPSYVIVLAVAAIGLGLYLAVK